MTVSPTNASVPSRTSAGRTRASSLFEGGMWSLAVLCGALLYGEARSANVAARAALVIQSPAQGSYKAANEVNASYSPVETKRQSSNAVIGRLEIAKIGLTVPVLENYDPESLKRGVGHIPGTASIGGLGNVGLAGHRDTFLSPLRNIRLGMEADVVTSEGKFRYMVDSTEIVTPDQVEVLDIHNRPELTLVTCYPFRFIGAAPKRFIVHAHLLSLDPD